MLMNYKVSQPSSELFVAELSNAVYLHQPVDMIAPSLIDRVLKNRKQVLLTLLTPIDLATSFIS
jgi:hypothetical protein